MAVRCSRADRSPLRPLPALWSDWFCDPAGAAIPQATVAVHHTQTSVSSRMETDSAGNYIVPQCGAGNLLDHRGEHPGFKRGDHRAG